MVEAIYGSKSNKILLLLRYSSMKLTLKMFLS